MMTKKYASFVVRCWSHEQGIIRVRVDHVQTKESHLADSLEAATAWMEMLCRAKPSLPVTAGKDFERN